MSPWQTSQGHQSQLSETSSKNAWDLTQMRKTLSCNYTKMLIQCSQLLSSIASFPGFPTPKQGVSIFVGLRAQTSERHWVTERTERSVKVAWDLRVSVRWPTNVCISHNAWDLMRGLSWIESHHGHIMSWATLHLMYMYVPAFKDLEKYSVLWLERFSSKAVRQNLGWKDRFEANLHPETCTGTCAEEPRLPGTPQQRTPMI